MVNLCDSFVAALYGRQVLHELATLHEKVNQTDLSTFHAIGLNNCHIARLLLQFSNIDEDKGGTISSGELMEYFELEQTMFTERIFDVMDEDGKGSIDFREFVIGCYNYCTLDQDSMVTFAFDLYDADSSGSIDTHEIELMLTEVYSNNFQSNRNAVALQCQVHEWNPTSEISFQAFKRFVKTHNLLLFPAFMLQRALRKKLLSNGFWEHCTRCRKELLKTNFTMGSLDGVQHAEDETRQRLSLLEMEERKGNAIRGRGFWVGIIGGRTLCERMKIWRQIRQAKKALATAETEKYMLTQIQTTQGTISDRVRSQERCKDKQTALSSQHPKRKLRDSSCLNNQNGFQHGNILSMGPVIVSDDHMHSDGAASENGGPVQRQSMIASLANAFGIGGTKTGRTSAVVDVEDVDELLSDEVGDVKGSTKEGHKKHHHHTASMNPNNLESKILNRPSLRADKLASGAAGLLPADKIISIEQPPTLELNRGSGGIHSLFSSGQDRKNNWDSSPSNNQRGSLETAANSPSRTETTTQYGGGDAAAVTYSTSSPSNRKSIRQVSSPSSIASRGSPESYTSINSIRSVIYPSSISFRGSLGVHTPTNRRSVRGGPESYMPITNRRSVRGRLEAYTPITNRRSVVSPSSISRGSPESYTPIMNRKSVK